MSGDIVFVRGLEFEANHGYTAAERRSTRRFRLGMEIRRDLGAASKSDRLADTIDYRQLCALAIEIGAGQTFRLLEGLAGAIADAVLRVHPDAEVTVSLEKLAPPCPGVPESCGVTLVRRAT